MSETASASDPPSAPAPGAATPLTTGAAPNGGVRARTDGSPTPTSLMHDYEHVLQAARRLSFSTSEPPASPLTAATARSLRRLFVSVPSSHRRTGIRRWVHTLPRPRWFLRYFVVDHMRRTLDAVRRRLLARAALRHPDDDAAQREAVAYYVESLPPQHRLFYSASLVALTVVLTRFLLLHVPGAAAQFGGTGSPGEADVIERLLTSVERTAAGMGSFDGLLAALATSPLRTTAFVVTSLATVLFVELRWLVPAFRLKRMLWNLHPRTDLLTRTPASWSVQRAVGVYACERSVARRLGAPPPREVPFDLIVSVLALPCLLFLAGMLVEMGTLDAAQPGEPWLSYTLAAAIVLGVGTRLGWLTRTWLRRMHAPDGPYLPSEARIRDSDLVIALRDPRTIAWATAAAAVVCVGIGLTVANVEVRTAGVFDRVHPVLTAFDRSRFLILVLVVGPLWYRINRDLHAYLSVRGDPPKGWPVLSLLAMAVPGLGSTALQPGLVVAGAALIAATVYRTCDRIRRAREIAGCQPDATPSGGAARDELTAPPLPSSASMVLRFVAFPVALAQIQRAVNTIWACDGQVLDHPAELNPAG